MLYLFLAVVTIFTAYNLQHYLLIRRAVKISHFSKDWTGEFWFGDKNKPDLSILVVGDSIAASLGINKLEDTIGARIAANFSPDHHVRLVNRGQVGIWSAGLSLEEIDGHWDYIIAIIGSNDLLHRVPLTTAKKSLLLLVEHLKKHSRMVVLAGPGEVSALSFLPVWYRFALKLREKQYSRMMDKVATSQRILYANPLIRHFKKSWFSKDQTHPNSNGDKVWSDVIWAAIQSKRHAPAPLLPEAAMLKHHGKFYVEGVFWIHTVIVLLLLTMGLFLPLWLVLLVIILQRIQLYVFDGCSITQYEQIIGGIPQEQLYFQYVSRRFFHYNLSRYGNHLAYLTLFAISVLLTILKNLNLI